MKRIALLVSGVLLELVFLAWMLFKGTESIRALTETNPVLGWTGWALAWACGLGGAALLARALFTKSEAGTD